MKIIIYIITVTLCLCTVYAYDYDYRINISKLPYTESLILIPHLSNNTMNITYGPFIFGESQKVFVEATDTIIVNISIANGTVLGNYSSYVYFFNENITKNTTFNFQIINDTPKSDIEYRMIGLSEFEYTVCDYLLPVSFQKNVSFIGYPDTTVQTIYNTTVFNIGTDFSLGSTGYLTIPININLPNTLKVGYFTSIVKFFNVDKFYNVTFHFDVKDCVTPFPECNDMVTVCGIVNKTTEDYLNCKRLEMVCSQKVYDSLVSSNKTYIVYNETVKYVNYTERVPVLDLKDEELVQTIKDLPTIWKQMITDQRQKQQLIDEKEGKITELNGKLSTIEDEIEDRLSKRLEVLIDENSKDKQTLMDYDKSYIKKTSIIGWAILAFLVIGGIYTFIIYHENNFW